MPWSTSTRSKPNQSSRPGNSNTVTTLSQRQQRPREPTNQQDSNSTYSSTGIAALNSSAVLVLYTAVPSTPGQLTHHVQQYSRKAVLPYILRSIYILWNTKRLQSESQFQKQTPLTDCYVGHSTESFTTMRDTTRRYRQKQELWELSKDPYPTSLLFQKCQPQETVCFHWRRFPTT